MAVVAGWWLAYKHFSEPPRSLTPCSFLPPEGAAAPADWQSQIRGPSLKSSGELPKVSFTVPSGNFGNVCAGHVARMMGLPIDKLVVATNENDVLDEFFRTGIYRVRTSD